MKAVKPQPADLDDELLTDPEGAKLLKEGVTRFLQRQKEDPDFPPPIWLGPRGKRHSKRLLMAYAFAKRARPAPPDATRSPVVNDPNQRRLKLARNEIEAIIKKYDVGAHVILHRPGWSEHFAEYSPSYSKLRMEGGAFLRFRSKLEEYGGDTEAQRRDVENTVNLIQHFEEVLRVNAAAMAHVLAMAHERFDIESTPGHHEPDVPPSANVQ